MKIILENIGLVEKAEIVINGITIIAGPNNTGKSTVSKSLFSIFNAMHDLDREVDNDLIASIGRQLFSEINPLTDNTEAFVWDSVKRIVADRKSLVKDESGVVESIRKVLSLESDSSSLDENRLLDISRRILKQLSVDDETLKKRIVRNKLKEEFSGQILNFNDGNTGRISLQIKENVLSIELYENEVASINYPVNLRQEPVYIDDPFLLDNLNRLRVMLNGGHRGMLYKQLTREDDKSATEEILTDAALKQIFEKLDLVSHGRIVYRSDIAYVYQMDDGSELLNLRNLSFGIKIFAIIKELLLNGAIHDNGTLILDEPEVHLHPEWQLILAEILVLLQQKFGLNMLINTHSPYFLRAVEVFAEKYHISDNCRYYLSSVSTSGAQMTDVTGDTEAIFKLLARPFQTLEDLRWSDD